MRLLRHAERFKDWPPQRIQGLEWPGAIRCCFNDSNNAWILPSDRRRRRRRTVPHQPHLDVETPGHGTGNLESVAAKLADFVGHDLPGRQCQVRVVPMETVPAGTGVSAPIRRACHCAGFQCICAEWSGDFRVEPRPENSNKDHEATAGDEKPQPAGAALWRSVRSAG